MALTKSAELRNGWAVRYAQATFQYPFVIKTMLGIDTFVLHHHIWVAGQVTVA